MSIREIAGLILIIAGVAITPLGWIVSLKLLIIAVALIAVGAALFWTTRVMRRQKRIDREQSGGGSYGTPVPRDINNSTGWLSGGRTKTIESSTPGHDADGD
jgi:membrane protein implicated in regulation of membrane protease activity